VEIRELLDRLDSFDFKNASWVKKHKNLVSESQKKGYNENKKKFLSSNIPSIMG